MDKKIIRKLQLAFWNVYEVPAACIYAGIEQKDYEKAVETDEKFAHCMARAQLYPTVKAKVEMMRRIAKGDGLLSMRFLERREPERYDLAYIRRFGKAED